MSCFAAERELVTFLLAGTLDPPDAEQVSRHLNTCPDCRAAVADGAAFIAGLRELHLRADDIVAAAAGEQTSPHLLVCSRCRDEVAVLRTINADLGAAAHGRRSRVSWWVQAAAAAAVALGVGLAWNAARDRQASGRMAAPAATPAATIARNEEAIEPLAVRVSERRALVLRRPDADSAAFVERFNQAIEPYRAGRYPEAAGRLAGLAAAFPDAPEPVLYEGVARLLAGDPATAVARLDRATTLAAGTEWTPDAEYYGARARLAAGRDEGRQMLVRLCASPGPYQAPSCRAAGASAPSPAR